MKNESQSEEGKKVRRTYEVFVFRGLLEVQGVYTTGGFPWLSIALVKAAEKGVSATGNGSSCCSQVL